MSEVYDKLHIESLVSDIIRYQAAILAHVQHVDQTHDLHAVFNIKDSGEFRELEKLVNYEVARPSEGEYVSPRQQIENLEKEIATDNAYIKSLENRIEYLLSEK